MTPAQPILVAGRSGQLARCLVEEGARLGASVVAHGRPDLDLRDSAALNRLIVRVRPRAIVNAAAFTAVDGAEDDPASAFAVNRDGAEALARAAAAAGIPFIHVSTDYVFDGTKTTPYREDDATGPLNVYGASKHEGEIRVRDAHPDAVVLRTSWVYSPYGTNFVTTMLRLAQTRDVVRVVDDQHGAPTAAADLARAILTIESRLADTPRGLGGLYHVTGSGSTTWCGFARAIFAGAARRGHRAATVEAIRSEEFPTKAHRPRYSGLDGTRAFTTFGVRLPPWQESLDATLDRLC